VKGRNCPPPNQRMKLSWRGGAARKGDLVITPQQIRLVCRLTCSNCMTLKTLILPSLSKSGKNSDVDFSRGR
jgi:hypothetical protein